MPKFKQMQLAYVKISFSKTTKHVLSLVLCQHFLRYFDFFKSKIETKFRLFYSSLVKFQDTLANY